MKKGDLVLVHWQNNGKTLYPACIESNDVDGDEMRKKVIWFDNKNIRWNNKAYSDVRVKKYMGSLCGVLCRADEPFHIVAPEVLTGKKYQTEEYLDVLVDVLHYARRMKMHATVGCVDQLLKSLAKSEAMEQEVGQKRKRDQQFPNKTGFKGVRCKSSVGGSSKKTKQKLQVPRNLQRWNTNKTGYKGVTKSGVKFVARITSNGNRRKIGLFDSAKDAAIAWDHEARKLGYEISSLNFPDRDRDRVMPGVKRLTKTSGANKKKSKLAVKIKDKGDAATNQKKRLRTSKEEGDSMIGSRVAGRKRRNSSSSSSSTTSTTSSSTSTSTTTSTSLKEMEDEQEEKETENISIEGFHQVEPILSPTLSLLNPSSVDDMQSSIEEFPSIELTCNSNKDEVLLTLYWVLNTLKMTDKYKNHNDLAMALNRKCDKFLSKLAIQLEHLQNVDLHDAIFRSFSEVYPERFMAM